MTQETEDYQSDAPATGADLLSQAAQTLVDHLEITSSMMARLELLTHQHSGDRITPVFAAARLINSCANATRAVGYAVESEARRRTLEERRKAPPDRIGLLIEATSEIVARRLNALATDYDTERETAIERERRVAENRLAQEA